MADVLIRKEEDIRDVSTQRKDQDTERRQPPAGQGKRPQEKPNLLAPWNWISSLQNCVKINFYCLNHPVSGTLLWQPEQSNTAMSSPGHPALRHSPHHVNLWVAEALWAVLILGILHTLCLPLFPHVSHCSVVRVGRHLDCVSTVPNSAWHMSSLPVLWKHEWMHEEMKPCSQTEMTTSLFKPVFKTSHQLGVPWRSSG